LLKENKIIVALVLEGLAKFGEMQVENNSNENDCCFCQF
jgi:hypothetical protein